MIKLIASLIYLFVSFACTVAIGLVTYQKLKSFDLVLAQRFATALTPAFLIIMFLDVFFSPVEHLENLIRKIWYKGNETEDPKVITLGNTIYSRIKMADEDLVKDYKDGFGDRNTYVIKESFLDGEVSIVIVIRTNQRRLTLVGTNPTLIKAIATYVKEMCGGETRLDIEIP